MIEDDRGQYSSRFALVYSQIASLVRTNPDKAIDDIILEACAICDDANEFEAKRVIHRNTDTSYQCLLCIIHVKSRKFCGNLLYFDKVSKNLIQNHLSQIQYNFDNHYQMSDSSDVRTKQMKDKEEQMFTEDQKTLIRDRLRSMIYEECNKRCLTVNSIRTIVLRDLIPDIIKDIKYRVLAELGCYVNFEEVDPMMDRNFALATFTISKRNADDVETLKVELDFNEGLANRDIVEEKTDKPQEFVMTIDGLKKMSVEDFMLLSSMIEEIKASMR